MFPATQDERLIANEAKLEIVRWKHRADEYLEIQIALDGVLCHPMDIHISDYLRCGSGVEGEKKFFAFLRHQGQTLLEMYGDARYNPNGVLLNESYKSLMEVA